MTREISPAIARCELTHVERQPIDFGRACVQHAAYRGLLGELGCRVIALPAVADQPDSVFVEDTAFVVDELAVIMRPGADSRQAETAAVERALAPYRELTRIEAPATMDGGDVLRLGKQVWVGLSSRTDEAAAAQLRGMLEPLGYAVHTLRAAGCLHLKSAVTAIGPEEVLVNPEWVDEAAFGRYRVVRVDPGEPFAANTVRIGDTLVVSTSFPRTNARLAELGYRCRAVESSELAKAEGGLSCCSVLFDA